MTEPLSCHVIVHRQFAMTEPSPSCGSPWVPCKIGCISCFIGLPFPREYRRFIVFDVEVAPLLFTARYRLDRSQDLGQRGDVNDIIPCSRQNTSDLTITESEPILLSLCCIPIPPGDATIVANTMTENQLHCQIFCTRQIILMIDRIQDKRGAPIRSISNRRHVTSHDLIEENNR